MAEEKFLKIHIDELELQVPQGTTILNAALKAGIFIPHFCFHPAFKPEGSCRMCLVEIEGQPKLETSCSTLVVDGMKVQTSSARALEGRREVLEFLLIDHPLDCPICDKAGECLLQEYYDSFGRFRRRIFEEKERKEKLIRIGKSLVLDRERCVLCTRCVRFLQNVTGTAELGVFERAVRSEIGIVEGHEIKNNYSGNLVDICPVGAITDGDFRFRTRAWFLKKNQTICPHCSRGCRIIVEWVEGYPLLAAGRRKIYRLRAGENAQVNGYWICDSGRYKYRDADEDRLENIIITDHLLPDGSGFSQQPPSRTIETIINIISCRISELMRAGDRSGVLVILNSFLTEEELLLAKKLFVDRLNLKKIYFADPKEGESDGLLLTPERCPNRAGARKIGFNCALPTLNDLESSKLILSFGTFIQEHYSIKELKKASAGSDWFIWSWQRSELERLARAVIPALHPYEKSGTYVNTTGCRQEFERAVTPLVDCLVEEEVFKKLAGKIGFEELAS